MDSSAKCPACGRSGLSYERRYHLELLYCGNCGSERWSTVYPGEEDSLIGRAEFVRIRIRWQGGAATPGEIVAVRKAIPALANEPLSRLLERARGSAESDLGQYPEPLAVEFQERAKRYGLDLVIDASAE